MVKLHFSSRGESQKGSMKKLAAQSARLLWILIFVLSMLGAQPVTPVQAATVCVTDTLTATADTWLNNGSSSSRNYNYGGSTTLQAQASNTSSGKGILLQWDLSDIPSDATINSASLVLNVTISSSSIFNLYDLKRAWIEGSNNGTAGSGASWTYYDAGSNKWTTGGAASTTSDRYNTNLWGADSNTFNSTSSKTVTLDTDGVALVQDWVDGTKPNYGLTIQNYSGSSSSGLTISSSEDTTPANQPKLVVKYCGSTPKIAVSKTLLDAFGSTTGAASEEQTYTVSGYYLQDGIVITAPTDFEISTTSGSNFNSSLTLSPTNNRVAKTTIYVHHLRATAGTSSGQITHATTGGTTQTVSVSGFTFEEWTAYNDCVGTSPANTTTITIGSGTTGTAGFLKDFSTGAKTSIKAQFTSSMALSTYEENGKETAAETDAYKTFHGYADMAGVVQYSSSSSTWTEDLTLSGLDPSKTYTFATSANRANNYTERITRYTLSGDEGATNASTTGVTVINDHSVYFVTGENTANGYVARWTGIKPGSDGTIVIRAEPQATEYRAYAIAVFMLKEEAVKPTITTSGSLSAFVTQPGVASTAQTYTVSGRNLTGDISISAPTGFELSAGGSTYSSSLTLPRTGTTVADTTVSVRLNSATKGSYSGIITHTSSGATEKDVTVSGKVADLVSLTTAVSPEGAGTVALSPAGPYYEGDVVTLTASANSGYVFSSWNGHLSGSANPATLTLDANKYVTAIFAEQTCSDVSLTDMVDTYISGASGRTTSNNGVSDTLKATLSTSSPRGSLLKWNLSSIPSNVNISSASLSLYVTTASTPTLNLYAMRQSWSEGTGDGSASGDGATWLTYNGSNTWETSGAAGTTTDRYNTNLWNANSSSFSATGSKTITLTSDGVNIIQQWLDGSIINNGLTIQNYASSSTTYDVNFASSENTTVANQPKLNIHYCTGTVHTLTVTNDGHGTVTTNPSQSAYADGTVVTLTPVASSGYAFSHWSGTNADDPVNNGDGTWSLTMNGDKALTANFSATPVNNPPNQPVLVQPADAATGVSLPPALEVTASDPDAGGTLNVNFYGRAKGSTTTSPDFMLALIPDPQNLSSNYPDRFNAQTQWMANQKTANNIVFVSTTGDMVNLYNNTTQYSNADAAMDIVDTAGIPYSVSPGNHDIPLTNFNIYFGVSRFSGKSWYGGSTGAGNENSYSFFSASGNDFIVINLEYNPSATVLTWAGNLLKANTGKRGIVISHSILNVNNTFTSEGTSIYNALKDNPNLFLMLCGHMHSGSDGSAYRSELGTDGHTIHILQSDYQDVSDAYLRLLRFSPADDKIYATVYSPYTNASLTSATNYEQMAMDYDLTNGTTAAYTLIGTVSGVTNGSNASVTWADRTATTEYEWYATVSDGTNITTGPTWSFTTGVPVTCYTLSLSHTGNGATPSASPEKSTGCASNGQYVADATISLSGASAAEDYYISSWTGTTTDTSTATANTVKMPASDHSAVVNYLAKTVPTLTASGGPYTYNGASHTVTVTASVDGTVSNIKYNGTDTAVNAGTYTITADFTPTDTTHNKSLSGAAVEGSLVINKATPTLAATGGPFTYDGAAHAAVVTGSVTGTVSDVQYGGASTATAAGSYAVTADFAPADSTNYNSLSDATAGTLVINKAALIVTAGDISKAYGKTVTFAGSEFTTTGLATVDSVTSVTLTSAGAAASAEVSGSPYDIVPSAATGVGLANYEIAYANGKLTVNKADQEITVTSHAPSEAVNGYTFSVAASGGGSGSPVLITSSGACSGSGENTADIIMTGGSGTCTVSYDQAGSGNYNAASQVQDSVTATSIFISGNTGTGSVTLSYGSSGTTTSGADGAYSIAVPYNWSGDVTPAKPGYTFSPEKSSYTSLKTSQTGQNFTATLNTYTISGSTGVEGATVSFSGGTAVNSGTGGAYSISVSHGWAGTITPAREGYTFSPASLSYASSPVTGPLTGQNFSATLNSYTIKGSLGVEGATLTVTDGASVTQDGSNYTITVPHGWTGTVTPGKAGYSFEPSSRTYSTPVTANMLSQDYMATVMPPGITTSVTVLEGFTGRIGQPSAVQSYTVSGSNLTAPLLITPPLQYQISRTNVDANFNSTVLSISASDAAKAGGVTIYVRLKHDIAGTINGFITHTSVGASDVSVAARGTVLTPTITTSGSLAAFTTTPNVPSAEQSYMLTGSNLIGDVTLTVPGAFQISQTSGSDFKTSLTLSPDSSGAISTIIYVRLYSSSAGLYGGNITHDSNSAAQKELTVSGNVVSCYLLTLTHTGVGQGNDPTATPAKSGACSTNGYYVAGESISLSTTPAVGSYITGWSGTSNDGSTADTNSLKMPANPTTVSVTYALTSLTISGSTGIGGVTLTATSGGVVSQTGSSYTVTVPYGWTGTVTPGRDGYTFSPASRSYAGSPVTTNLTNQDFTPLVTISGSTGIGEVTLNYGTTENPLSVTSGSGGAYAFTVPYGWTGTVTPAKGGFSFDPSSLAYTTGVTASLSGQNFTPRVTISGSTGASGVTLSYTDGSAKTAVSAEGGAYAFTVSYGWTGTVTPSLSGVIFDPATREYATAVTENLSAQNFTPKVTISGSAGISGATLSYTDGVAKTITVNDGGAYSLTLPYNWSGRVTPALAGYTFTPAYIEYAGVVSSHINQNYTPAINRYDLTVNKTGAGTGVVTSSPAGIDCGLTCSASFDHGTPVTLSAAPSPDSIFVGWAGGICNGTGTCTLTMTEARSVEANFSLITHDISLQAGWNLVSLDLHPSNTAISAVLASIEGKYSLVYAWDATGAHSGSGNWLKADDQGSTTDTLTALDETMGFWIQMKEAATLTVSGSEPASSSITLLSGWNLVGYPAAANQALPVALSDHGVTDFSMVNAFYPYDTADPWKIYDKSAPDYANDLTELAPKWGYWIKAGSTQTWTP